MIGKTTTIDFIKRHLNYHFAGRNVGLGLVPALLSYRFGGSKTRGTHQLYRPFTGITFAQGQFHSTCLSPMVDMCHYQGNSRNDFPCNLVRLERCQVGRIYHLDARCERIKFQSSTHGLQKGKACNNTGTQAAISGLLEYELHSSLTNKWMPWYGIKHRRLLFSQCAYLLCDTLVKCIPTCCLIVKRVEGCNAKVG